MKVNISHTFEVTDEQRSQITSVNEGKVMKRRANREQCRDFIEANGYTKWEVALAYAYMELTAPSSPEAEEDLLGGESPDEGLDDLIGAAPDDQDDPLDVDDLI